MNSFRTLISLLVLISFSFAFISESNAQSADWGGVGYSTNLPDQYFGVDLRRVNEDDIGGFFQFKTSRFPPEAETYEDISEDTFNDPEVNTLTNHTSLSGGLTYGIGEHFHVWGGLGVVHVTDYAELDDPTDILGSRDGKYWVITNEETKPKFLFGGGYTNGSWYALLGKEFNPSGVNVTIGYRFNI